MKGQRFWILAAFSVTGLATGCGGDDGDPVCDYDQATEVCQQAYDCCNQYVEWAVETSQPGSDTFDCEPYICFGTPDSTCQGWIDQAVSAEETYEVDFPDCS
ncbi:MAG: hypothetical protein JXB39_00760 [Deltaproteobacteria bacterium]|nr:hypothetical protein [Deltaproteobacteria bacterium]